MFLSDNINIFIEIYISFIAKSLLSLNIYITLLIYLFIYIIFNSYIYIRANSVVLVDLVSLSNFFV